ncbi:MAG: phosphotransferase [Opitutales bacterium]
MDNTVCDYGAAWAWAASEILDGAWDITSDPRRELKKHFQEKPGGNLEWTELQGIIYGQGIEHARIPDGLLSAMDQWRAQGGRIVLVSHKTRYPAYGECLDLHAAAEKWLYATGLIGKLDETFFEATVQAKIDRIAALRPQVFVDDLEMIGSHPDFPKTTQFLHYSSPEDWTQLEAVQKLEFRDQGLDKEEMPPLSSVPNSKFSSLKSKTLSGGLNNAVTSEGDTVLKTYPQSPADARRRYGREVAFLETMQGVGRIPKVIEKHPEEPALVMEKIPGRLVDTSNLTTTDWDQAVDWLKKLFIKSGSLDRSQGPKANEACFSLMDYLGVLHLRRDRLAQNLEASQSLEIRELKVERNDGDPSQLSNLNSKFLNLYSELAKRALSHPEFKTKAPASQHVYSPSDIGFHNTLRLEDGTLAFIDFEFAGWDDGAGLLADFISQPRVSEEDNPYASNPLMLLDEFRLWISDSDETFLLKCELRELWWSFVKALRVN